MISKQRIFVFWLMFQLGNLLSIFFGVTFNTALANTLFSGLFMVGLLMSQEDKQ